jgi:hypothetical protein
MPIVHTNSTFIEFPFGNSTSFLQNNSGDTAQADFIVEESIAVNSNLGNTIERDAFTNIITWFSGDWEAEGFRAGDSIEIQVYEVATGNVTSTHTTTIDWIDEDEMKVASLSSNWYGQNEAVYITTTRNREGVEIFFNMVQSGGSGSEFSLIDGEPTRFMIDLQNPAIPVTTQIGNKSGAYELTMAMGLISSVNNVNTYRLRVTFTTSGLYDSSVYDFSSCLKPYLKLSWMSLINEPQGRTEIIINDEADTGGFNEGYNSQAVDSVLVQGISELFYEQPTSGTFVIDSSSSKFCQGSGYFSSDDSYYKSQTSDQSSLTMLLASDEVVIAGTPRTSPSNPDGASYDFQIDSVNVAGTIYTLEFTMTPNNQFGSFMEARGEGDRLFKVWMKWGNTNVLVFSGQMSSAPAVTQNLVMEVSDYFDHSENLIDSSDSVLGYSGNIEDEFAFVGKFFLTDNFVTNFVRASIQSYNLVTGEYFTLTQTNFSLVGIPQVNGEYVLDLEAPVLTSLPETSKKRIATLTNDNSLVTPPKLYGVRIYYPFQYDWRYWQSLPSANADFYPDAQTKSWLPYGTQGDWRLRLNIEVDKNDTLFQFRDDIFIMDYNSNSNIDQEIQLWRDNPLSQVSIIIEGELMRIVALHTNLDGSSWSQTETWGMITIEPTESSPRWISSTAIDFDGNVLNPLTPLSGLRCDLSFPTQDVARLECYLDSTKINLENGVKITSKIKGCNDGEPQKMTTWGQQKLTTFNDIKLKS